MKNGFCYIAVFFLLSQTLMAQNLQRIFENLKQTETGIEIQVNDGTYNIKFYAQEIVETSFIPKGETFEAESHAVVMKPETVVSKLQPEDNKITFHIF